jgi:PAS domain S-box-containing protein
VLSRLKIAFRINLLLVLAAFGMLACAGIGLWALRTQMLEEKRVQLRLLMDLVINDARADMNEAGGPTTEAGRNAFLEVLRRAKWGDSPFNFFFVYDYDGLVLWHPDTSKIGVNRSNVVYPNGVKMVQKFLEIAKNNPLGGFSEYEGPDNRGSFGPKLSHLRSAPELTMVIGVGANIADVDAAFYHRLQLMAFLFASVMIAIGLASMIVSRSIGEPLSNAVRKIKRLASGDLDIAPADAADKSELGEVDKALDILRANAIDRMSAARALRDSELRMRLAQEAARAGTWESRPGDKINVWSDALWKLFGLQPGECKPTHEAWLSTIHPDDRELVMAEVKRAAAAGQAFEIQWRVNRPQGEPERWLFARGRPISEETPDNYFGVVIDITEHKLMEQALRESEERMRMAQEGARAVTWEWRLADDHVELPDTIWSQYGFEKPEQWNSSFESVGLLVHPTDRQRVIVTVVEAAASGRSYEVQWRLNAPESDPVRWFMVRGRPMLHADGSADRYFGVIMEITEQKLAEEALRESEMRMRLAQEAARVGAWEWRLADKSRHLTESLWNLYGVKFEERDSSFEGWMSILHPSGREHVVAAVMKAVSLRQDYEVEWRWNAAEGEPERWFLTRGKPVAGASGAVDRYFGVVIDITKQKLMERALRDSEERRSFLLSLNDALRCTHEPAEAIAFAAEMLGQKLNASQIMYFKTDASGEHASLAHVWNDGVRPDTFALDRLSDCDPAFLQALESGQTVVSDDARSDPRCRKNSAQAFLERGSVAAFVAVPFVKDRRIAGFLAVHKRDPYHWEEDEISLAQDVAHRTWDMVERALASRALRESEERQSFLLSLNDALRVTADPVEAIATASKMLGQKLEAAQVFYAEIDPSGTYATISRDWSDGAVPSACGHFKLDDFDPSFFGALRTGRTIAVSDVRAEPHRWSPMGRAFFERSSMAAVMAVPLVKDGKFLAVLSLQKGFAYDWAKNEVALVLDVAERTWEAVERARFARALRESDERLKFAIDAADVGSWEMVIEAQKYVASDRALFFFDFPSGAQPDYQEILDRVHPDDRKTVDAALWSAVETGQPFKIEFRRLLADGSILWLEARGERRFYSGKSVIGGLVQDITEKVNQKEAVERAAKAKSEFLANMSHELRTPMHAILSFAKFGRKKCATSEKPELDEYFEIIQTSGTRLLGLLNDLLDLAKLESGKMIMKRSHGDFLNVIEQTKVELSALLNERSITLNTKVLTENTKSAFDKQRMIQVLMNLISNSIKFSPKGSEICVTVTEGRSSDGAEVLRCSVGDEGPGIPKDELETVFDQFTQSSQTKTGAGGTGLGLPICREIIKAHGGHIWAENSASKGALLSFVVPRSQGV